MVANIDILPSSMKEREIAARQLVYDTTRPRMNRHSFNMPWNILASISIHPSPDTVRVRLCLRPQTGVEPTARRLSPSPGTRVTIAGLRPSIPSLILPCASALLYSSRCKPRPGTRLRPRCFYKRGHQIGYSGRGGGGLKRYDARRNPSRM